MNCRCLWIILVGLVVGVTVIGADSNAPDVRDLYFRLQLKEVTPAEVTVTPGTFRIIVLNSVVNGRFSVTLSNNQEGDEVDDNTDDRSLSSSHLVTLREGRHVLQLGKHPKWKAVINVKP